MANLETRQNCHKRVGTNQVDDHDRNAVATAATAQEIQGNDDGIGRAESGPTAKEAESGSTKSRIQHKT